MAGAGKDKGAALERVGREVLRASAENAEEAERVASSPYLYARVRAGIAAERARREEAEWWRAALAVFWRAVPAMALVAALAFALSLFASAPRGRAVAAAGAELLSPGDVGVEGAMFAEGRGFSNDEILDTILDEEEGEGPR
ncbi:MAG TPA: hypothetical protein VGX48_14935 [Pyrinomonadaceae bacterium]|jgi:hypothetical protein|nr:hypothetical protein [Pyrinomonadaceae bacterium]